MENGKACALCFLLPGQVYNQLAGCRNEGLVDRAGTLLLLATHSRSVYQEGPFYRSLLLEHRHTRHTGNKAILGGAVNRGEVCSGRQANLFGFIEIGTQKRLEVA